MKTKSNLLLENENLRMKIKLEKLKNRKLVMESTETEFKSKLVDFLLSIDIDDYTDREWFGIRYDNKPYDIGDYLPNSKDNVDRDDSREFPEYGTTEFDEYPELDGTSAYGFIHIDDLYNLLDDGELEVEKFVNDMWNSGILFTPEEAFAPNITIISGTYADTENGEDNGEWIISDARVEAILF